MTIHLFLLGPVLLIYLNLRYYEKGYHRKNPFIQQLFTEYLLCVKPLGQVICDRQYIMHHPCFLGTYILKGKINICFRRINSTEC